MRRFLVHMIPPIGARTSLGPEESRHALKVLRLTEGTLVRLTDGQGTEAEGLLMINSEGWAEVEVQSLQKRHRHTQIEIIQGVLKGPKMDWLVEKLTEIGVAEIRLAETKHTVAKGEKIERWQRIAQSAVKQSGNSRIPSIHAVQPLPELVGTIGEGLKVLLQPGAKLGLADLVRQRKTDRIILAIGPEGGFAPSEERLLGDAGFVPAALSSQILRGETAALVAAALTAHAIDF